jgi:hypothetical protein
MPIGFHEAYLRGAAETAGLPTSGDPTRPVPPGAKRTPPGPTISISPPGADIPGAIGTFPGLTPPMGGSAPDPGAIGLMGTVCAIAAVAMLINTTAAAVITERCERRIGVPFTVGAQWRADFVNKNMLCLAHDLASIAMVKLSLRPS